jgi:phage shock protein PspC (stress-responsive transcriptional regulator)
VVGILTFTPIAYVVAWILMPADAETEAAPVAAAAA